MEKFLHDGNEPSPRRPSDDSVILAVLAIVVLAVALAFIYASSVSW